MKKLHVRSVVARAAALALVSVVALAGCGGGGDDPPPDAPPASDGGVDGMPDAGGLRNVDDFQPCVLTSDCKNTGSDCVFIAWTEQKQCIPKCGSTAECPVDTYCYPDSGLPPAFQPMSGHCWLSLCGEALMNGTAGGSCNLGGEFNAPASDQLPGWCYPLRDNNPDADPPEPGFGICLEVGTVPPGGTCTNPATADRTSDRCDATGRCIEVTTGQFKCQALCDPRTIATRPAGDNSGCAAGEDCYDASFRTTYASGDAVSSTFGICFPDLTACTTVPPNNVCPDAADGSQQGCFYTNPVRPTGVCDPIATGDLAADATCTPLMQSTPPADRCTAGTLCNGESSTTLTCQTICDINAAPVVTCPGTTTCTALLWDGGFDETAGTPDDNYTFGWGTCQ